MRRETDGPADRPPSCSSLLGLHPCVNARGKDGFLDRAAEYGGRVQPADRVPDAKGASRKME